jgi:hypothetical protein
MAGEGQRLLGEYYDKDHLTHGEIDELGLKVVTEKGEEIEPDALQDKVFRFADRDEPSGYVVRRMEDAEAATELSYLQER